MELLIHIFKNLLDIIIIFYITLKLVDRLAVITVKRVIIAIAYGVIFGTLAYVTDSSVLYQVIAIASQAVIVNMLVKRGFISSLFAFGLYLVFLTIFQLSVVSVCSLLNLNPALINPMTQALTAIVAIIIYKAVPTNKVFEFIEKQLLLKFVILLIALFSILVGLYVNFGTNMPLLVLFLVLVSILLAGLYKSAKDIYHLSYTVPLKLYDFKNSLHGSMVKAYQEGDEQKIGWLKEQYANHDFALDTSKFQLGKDKENILAFIEEQRISYGCKAEVISEIIYYKDHREFGIDKVVKVLDTLLKNAFETGTRKPIMVNILVGLDEIKISVSNEYEMTDPNSINRMFEPGFSTKEADRGYGLDNLYHNINQFNGKIINSYDYNDIGRASYLTIRVEI